MIKDMKKSTKKTKPTFVVDLTNATSVEDVKIAFVEAKVKAGVPITMNELLAYVRIGLDIATELQNCNVTIIESDELALKMLKLIKKYENKKTPWYKRFWNWITRKK